MGSLGLGKAALLHQRTEHLSLVEAALTATAAIGCLLADAQLSPQQRRKPTRFHFTVNGFSAGSRTCASRK